MPIDEDSNWPAVTARCLAYLCLKDSQYAEASLLEKAGFLEKLGLPLEDRAAIIGSTPASLRELARQAKSRKAKGKNAKTNGKSAKTRRR